MKPRAWREKEKLNLVAAAARLGITKEYLSMLERGIRNPSLEVLEAFDRESGGQVTQRDFYQ